MDNREQEKQLAARKSLEFLSDGQVVGLGTGTTATYMIRFLAERVRAGLRIRGIASSVHSEELAVSLGIPLTTLAESREIDVCIDGADEIDPALQLIKGGGGALLREKIVASASRKFVVIADSSKQVPILGECPLPVEVVPFAQPLIARRIAALGALVALRRNAAGGPFVTDSSNHLLDCAFRTIADPVGLSQKLLNMPGLVDHGLFLDMADVVLIGKGSQVLEYRRAPGQRTAKSVPGGKG
jgi:ribose 5-phosphate isomerase A